MSTLTLTKREITGKKVKQMRKLGDVPVVLYGPKFASSNFTADSKTFKSVFADSGYSNIINLSLDGESKEKALIKEVQMNPVTDEIWHVSLYIVDKNTSINAEVPIELIGLSPAEDLGLGFVVQNINEVPVKCLPEDLPSKFEVDVTKLENAGDTILISDLVLPDGVELTGIETDTAIAYIATAQKMEESFAESTESEEAAGDRDAASSTAEASE